MSGGVDSAVAAARMLDAGHEVVGVHLALSQSAATLRESARGCCTIEDAGDARRVADVLGIPFYVWDMAARFRQDVVDDFRAEYAAGRTPNPCLRCNEKIKFAALLDKAVALGFDAVATGHYAQVVETREAGGAVRRELHRAVDPAKDQSYVLGVLDADQLERAFFPLGDTTKPQVRAEAAERGFFIARKPDSHDICFIPDGDTRGWLTRELGAAPGDIVDTAGEVVGRHEGAFAYTVGQRRGLGLSRPAADGQPRYVVEVRPATSQVVVGEADLLGVNAITGDHARWCGPAPEGIVRVGAQVRAHGEEYAAAAWGEGDRVEVRLEGRVRGVAPGQSVVLYDGTRVVGSATIPAARLDRAAAPVACPPRAEAARPASRTCSSEGRPRPGDGARGRTEAERAIEPLRARVAVVPAGGDLHEAPADVGEVVQRREGDSAGEAAAAVLRHAPHRFDEADARGRVQPDQRRGDHAVLRVDGDPVEVVPVRPGRHELAVCRLVDLRGPDVAPRGRMDGGALTRLVLLDVPEAVVLDPRHGRERVGREDVVGEPRGVVVRRESCCGQGLLGHVAFHDQRRLRLGVADLLEPLDEVLCDVRSVRCHLELEPVRSLGPAEADGLRAVG